MGIGKPALSLRMLGRRSVNDLRKFERGRDYTQPNSKTSLSWEPLPSFLRSDTRGKGIFRTKENNTHKVERKLLRAKDQNLPQGEGRIRRRKGERVPTVRHQNCSTEKNQSPSREGGNEELLFTRYHKSFHA